MMIYMLSYGLVCRSTSSLEHFIGTVANQAEQKRLCKTKLRLLWVYETLTNIITVPLGIQFTGKKPEVPIKNATKGLLAHVPEQHFSYPLPLCFWAKTDGRVYELHTVQFSLKCLEGTRVIHTFNIAAMLWCFPRELNLTWSPVWILPVTF